MRRLIKKIYNCIRFNINYSGKYEYETQPDDTLWSLSEKFDIPHWAIIYQNRKNPNCGSLVFPYKTLWIPLKKPTRGD